MTNSPLKENHPPKTKREDWELDLSALMAKYRDPKHEQERLVRVLYFIRQLRSESIAQGKKEEYEKGRNDQREIDDRMRQAQLEYCKHEKIVPVQGFWCRECGKVWNDRKQMRKSKLALLTKLK